jgi:hypothetical protein
VSAKRWNCLKSASLPFVEREVKAKYRQCLGFRGKGAFCRTPAFGAGIAASLVVMDRKWSEVFRQILGKTRAQPGE